MDADERATFHVRPRPPLHCGEGQCCPFFIPFTAVVRALPVYPTVRLGAALVLRFRWMIPSLQLLFWTLLTCCV